MYETSVCRVNSYLEKKRWHKLTPGDTVSKNSCPHLLFERILIPFPNLRASTEWYTLHFRQNGGSKCHQLCKVNLAICLQHFSTALLELRHTRSWLEAKIVRFCMVQFLPSPRVFLRQSTVKCHYMTFNRQVWSLWQQTRNCPCFHMQRRVILKEQGESSGILGEDEGKNVTDEARTLDGRERGGRVLTLQGQRLELS